MHSQEKKKKKQLPSTVIIKRIKSTPEEKLLLISWLMIHCLWSINVTFDRDKLLETGQVIEMTSILLHLQNAC